MALLPHGAAAGPAGAGQATLATPRTLAPAGDGGCPGSCEGVCWEPETGPSRTHWKFVGEGQGTYEKLPQYSFVGKGNGTYQQAQVREQVPGSSCAPGCTDYAQKALPFTLGVGIVLLIFFGGSLLTTHLQSSAGQAAAPSGSNSVVHSSSGVAAGAGLDCQPQGEATWSARQRQQCCASLGVGCETTTEPFDCMAGYHIWEEAWSAGHKAWCCDHYRRGCEVTTTAVPFNCEDGYPEHVADGWSSTKKAWCCEHEHVSCPEDPALARVAGAAAAAAAAATAAPSPTTTTEFHDCQQDYASWTVSWSAHKKAWCCEHEQAGCPTAAPSTTPPPPPPPPPPPATTPAPAPMPVPTLTPRYPMPAPSPMPSPMPSTAPRPTPPHYVCTDGLAASWPPEQQSWCCQHEQICFDVVAPAPAAAPTVPQGPQALAAAAGGGGCEQMCTFGGNTVSCKSRINWLVTHSLRASEGACSVAVQKVLAQCPVCHGCTAAGAQCHEAEPYDCQPPEAGFVWSPSKSDWCCKHQSVGCKTSGGESHFDCAAGWSNWEKGWAIKKKAWCCIHAGKACPPAKTMARLPFASMTYDCQDGYSNWQKDWSVGKKAWCCINKRKGCDQ